MNAFQILVLKRVVEGIVPRIEKDIDSDDCQFDCNDGGQQGCGPASDLPNRNRGWQFATRWRALRSALSRKASPCRTREKLLPSVHTATNELAVIAL